MRPPHEVFEDHLRLAQEGNVEEDLQRNYANDVKVLTRWGRFDGHEGTRALAERLMTELPRAVFDYTTTFVVDEIAYLEWTGRGARNIVRDGADTFWIRDGKIQVQTIRYTVEPAP